MKHNNISIEWEVEMPLRCHRTTEMNIHTNYQGRIESLTQQGPIPKRFSGKPLSTSISNRKDQWKIKATRKKQDSEADLDPSGMEIWFTPLSKVLRPEKVILAGGKGNNE